MSSNILMATDLEVGKYYEVTERLEKHNSFEPLSISRFCNNGCPTTNYSISMTTFGQMSPNDRDALRRQIKLELPGLEEKLCKQKQQEEASKKRKEKRRLEKYTQHQEEASKKRIEEDAKIPKYRISDELAKFLGKPAGVKMSRSEVNLFIARYIEINNLKKSYSTNFRVDSKLSIIINANGFGLSSLMLLQTNLDRHFFEQREENQKKIEEIEFEKRFKEEEKEQRYQDYKNKKISSLKNKVSSG